jgi:hypothetical protein
VSDITDEQLTKWSERVRYPDGDDIHAMVAELIQLRQFVRDFTDPDDCWFDHHGGCQAHGFLSLEPGELCPQAEAKQWLAQWEADEQIE